MSVGSWCIRVAPPARAGLLGSAFLQVSAARVRAGRCRAAQHGGRVRLGGRVVVRAGSAETPVSGTNEDAGAAFSETFLLRRRCQAVEKAWVTVDAEPDAQGKCKVVVGCNVAGKWGVPYDDEQGRSTAPITEKGKLRSWVGPNGQYYRELPCPSCRGRGYTPCKKCGIDRSSLDCPMCNGKGIRMCLQCSGECVIWQESVDELPWEKVRSSSPLKVKEDDEVDKLEININNPKRSKRTYASPSPEVAMKISRSLRSLNAQTGLFTKHMKIIHQDPELRAQRVAAIKRAKGTAVARKRASEIQKAFFSDPENRLKRSIAMKGVKFYCSKCGQEGHRSFYCPTVRNGSTRPRFRCGLCGGEGHNSRTCGKPKSEKEHQQPPRHCSQCGEKGHNRRNCPRSTDVGIGASGSVVNKVNGSSSAAYSCSLCLEKGHNRRTCPKRKADFLNEKCE